MSPTRVAAYAAAATIVGATLVFDPAGWAPFGPAKWAVVSTLAMASAAVAIWSGEVAHHRGASVAWTVFLAWGVVVSATALDPLYTWIGTPDRHLGLAAWLLFAVLFVSAQQLVERRDVETVFRGAAVAGIGAGIYVLLEITGHPPVDLLVDSGRAGGPFGSAAYLGAAATVLLPMTVGGAAGGLTGRAWRIASACGAVAVGIAALASQTRAGWIGLAAAAIVALPSVGPWLRRRPVAASLGAAMVVLVVAASPAPARLAAMFDIDGGTTRGRIDEWQVGAAVLADHPILGTGFEGYRIAFPGRVDADYERRYTRATMPDRSHNGMLDVAVTTGILGLLVYMAGAVWLIVRAWSATRTRDAVSVALGAAVIGFVVQQQFLFPTVEVDAVFWIVAGLLVARTGLERQGRVEVPRALAAVPLALSAALLVAGGLDVVADHRIARAEALAAPESADSAVRLRPDSIRYRFVASTLVAAGGDAASLGGAIDRIEDAIRISPGDPLLRARRGALLVDLARLTLSPDDIRAASDAYADLIVTDPHNASVRLGAGIAFFVAGDRAGAESQWLVAGDLAPGSVAPLTNLAALYVESGRIDEAMAMLDRARAIDPDSPAIAEIEGRLDE